MVRVALLALMLAGCDSVPRTWSKSEIAEIAADQAPDTLDLRSEIAILKMQVQRLEQEAARDREYQNGMHKAGIADTDTLNREIDRLTRNDDAFLQHMNYLRSLHGRPPRS